jgi:TonB family protein
MMMRISSSVLGSSVGLLLAFCSAMPLLAQDGAATAEVCDAIQVPDARVPVAQFLTLSLRDRDGSLRESLSGSDRRTAESLLGHLRPKLTIEPPSAFPSTPLLISAPFVIPRKGSAVSVPNIATELDAWLHRDGRMTAATLARPSAVPRADTVLLRSVQSLVKDDTLATFAARLSKDSIGIRLSTSLVFDADRESVRMPLHEVQLPAFQETPVTNVAGSRGPEYPLDLRRNGVSGSVLFEFWVDSRGRPEVSTFRVIRSSHKQFSDAVVRAVQMMRFNPATIGGCGVRQMVRQSFGFSLH